MLEHSTSESSPADGNVHERISAPDHDEIAGLAFSYWEQRGRPDGSAYEDWLRAEGQLKLQRESNRDEQARKAANGHNEVHD